jgi:putative 4-mercaptohistidine N1-methyltranferase
MDYESDILRHWYLLFHYGDAGEILDGAGFGVDDLPAGCLDFPVATVGYAGLEKNGVERALDLGCAVGRSAFEMSRSAAEVVAIDYSAAFVSAAEALRTDGEIAYLRYRERHLAEPMRARRPAGARPERIRFEQGDAMDLRADLGEFDLVHAANLLCRLPDPERFLRRLPSLVKPGGSLVLATPATWMDDYTPRDQQPEGETLDYLRARLSSDFELVRRDELPFLMREHQRKFQLSTSQTSLWRRR